MKVFITGGGGFLGGHIIKKLLEENHEITSYSRSAYPQLQKLGVKCIEGDLSDKEMLVSASADHDVFFHVASKVAMWGKEEDFYETNVIGTENVLNACIENSIPHLIYTSTPSVVFGQESLKGVNESQEYPQQSVSRYGRSKATAEKLVLKANSPQLKTVALRPHLIFGAEDQNLIPRLVTKAQRGKLRRIGNGENLVDVIYVENAADAHICAWKALVQGREGVAGEPFFIGQGPVKLWSFIDKVLELHGIGPVKKNISFKLAYNIGKLIETLCELFKIYRWDPPMTRFVALQLNCDHYFNHTRANEKLGWKPRISVEEGLSRLL